MKRDAREQKSTTGKFTIHRPRISPLTMSSFFNRFYLNVNCDYPDRGVYNPALCTPALTTNVYVQRQELEIDVTFEVRDSEGLRA